MFLLGALLIPGSTTDTVVAFDNPLGQPGPLGTVAKGVAVTGLALHAVSLPAALLCVILRFRAARGVERQQPTRTSLWRRPSGRQEPLGG